jgi:RNA polymerase sigma factor (sigma-70 family)
MQITEKELIHSCIKGNRNSQRLLYEQFSAKMFALCLRYAKDRMEAEDFLQEGFIKIFTNLGQYKFEGSFEGWVRRIMVTTALQHLRKDKQQAEYELPENHLAVADEYDVTDKLSADELMAQIQSLPTGYRTVFNLYILEEFSHKEIAAELGISEGTSKSQLARARVFLQKMIKKNENIQDKLTLGSGITG